MLHLLDLVDGSDMTDSTVSEDDEEDYINCWNPYRKFAQRVAMQWIVFTIILYILVYQLQQKAPTPRCVPCRDPVSINMFL